MLSLLLSVLALLATFYQLYLQRVHNQKSLKPLGQIVLEDQRKTLAVHLRNNGLGPLIIDQISCHKDGKRYNSIDQCLDLPPRSYMRTPLDDVVMRVVLPNSSLVIFETCFDEGQVEATIDHVRQQLALLTLTIEFRDIYDNKMTIERDCQWFVRYDSVLANVEARV